MTGVNTTSRGTIRSAPNRSENGLHQKSSKSSRDNRRAPTSSRIRNQIRQQTLTQINFAKHLDLPVVPSEPDILQNGGLENSRPRRRRRASSKAHKAQQTLTQLDFAQYRELDSDAPIMDDRYEEGVNTDLQAAGAVITEVPDCCPTSAQRGQHVQHSFSGIPGELDSGRENMATVDAKLAFRKPDYEVPLPQTPRKSRTQEVPSSQSPSGTPLTAHDPTRPSFTTSPLQRKCAQSAEASRIQGLPSPVGRSLIDRTVGRNGVVSLTHTLHRSRGSLFVSPARLETFSVADYEDEHESLGTSSMPAFREFGDGKVCTLPALETRTGELSTGLDFSEAVDAGGLISQEHLIGTRVLVEDPSDEHHSEQRTQSKQLLTERSAVLSMTDLRGVERPTSWAGYRCRLKLEGASPSQRAITDISRSSSESQTHRSSRFSSSPSWCPLLAMPSSPVAGKRHLAHPNTQDGQEDLLTATQLLPDSLMNFSLPHSYTLTHPEEG